VPVEQRKPLSRDRILAAALALADAEGLGALTMRRLAQSLDVEAMSLYNHVANKDDIVAGVVDLVMAEVDLPDPALPWMATIRASAVSVHLALCRHPWAANLVMSAGDPSPARLAWMNGVLGCLRTAGCSVELTHHAYHALDSHIIGFSLWVSELPITGSGLNELAGRMVNLPPFTDYPWLQEHMRYHMEEPHPEPDYTGSGFEFGLDLILEGVERRRAPDATDS
jgi:hypothetical protein